MIMKYKVGDKVLIKSIDWYNTCANNWVYVPFNDYMKKYCGQIMTINFVGGFSYNMIEDGGKYLWTDEMIEGLSASKYNKGDFVGVYGYENIKSCQKELSESLDSSQLEKSNILLKVRESLMTNKGELIMPRGITRYPHNTGYSIFFTISIIMLIIGIAIMDL